MLAVVRRERSFPSRAAMMPNQSPLFCFPPSPCRRSPDTMWSLSTQKKQKTQHARNRALHCALLTLHHGSVTLHIHHQQRVRVRVAAERLVARTRSESSSWLAHHCRCGKPTTALLQARPRQERERGVRIPLHSMAGARMIESTLLCIASVL